MALTLGFLYRESVSVEPGPSRISYVHPGRTTMSGVPVATIREPAQSAGVSYVHPRRKRSASNAAGHSNDRSTSPPEAEVNNGPEEDPDILLQDVVAMEIRTRKRVMELAAHHDRLSRMVATVTTHLTVHEAEPAPGLPLADLKSVGVPTERYAELAREYAHARARGGIGGAVRKSSLRPRIAEESALLLTRLKRLATAALRARIQAVAMRDATVTSLRQRRGAIENWMNARPLTYERLDDYRGATAAATVGHVMPYVPHTGWTADPSEDAPWALLPVSTQQGLLCVAGTPGLDYEQACSAVRTQVLEQMARSYPRRLIVTWIDPLGRGASAGAILELLEIDKDLMDAQVWSEADQIRLALRRITDRMAYLEQRCLKSRFADLDEYNQQAGVLAEPYHVVAVTGYPRNFNDESLARLAQIERPGQRLGITVHIATDPSVGAHLRVGTSHIYPEPLRLSFPGGADIHGEIPTPGHIVFGHAGRPHAAVWVSAVNTVVWTAARFRTFSDQAARRIVEGYATAAVEATNVQVDWEGLAAQTAANGSSQDGIRLPVGALGRGDRFDLELGKGLAQNLLIGGLPGSGKSTLMHTIITAAVSSYEPDEIELYLLDFKQGVEFQPYADAMLPHARVVAVQSERAFGLSVLRGLRAELDRRAELFRGPQGMGADSISAFRKRTNLTLSRILIVVDEFQVLFNANDQLAEECARLLDQIVRQGRAFGVHMILGTQTMRGDTMRYLSSTMDQIALRIVLKTSETDSELFLAPRNVAGARLTRPGEAIFNPDGGSPEGNLGFQVAMTSDDSRAAVLAQATRRAGGRGQSRQPIVFDGTRAVDVREDDRILELAQGAAVVDKRMLRLHVGSPVALGGSGAIDLWRRSNANVLVVNRDWNQVTGALLVALTTACLSGPPMPEITVVDCMGVDDDYGSLFAEFAQASAVRAYRRPRMASCLKDAAAEVETRIAADNYSAARRILVINGLQRSREFGDVDSYDPTPTLGHLRAVLRDGADVGVHVIISSDSYDSVVRRIGANLVELFGHRLIGPCSEQASHALVGSAAACGLSPVYSILFEPDESKFEQIRPFPVPEMSWLHSTLGSIGR